MKWKKTMGRMRRRKEEVEKDEGQDEKEEQHLGPGGGATGEASALMHLVALLAVFSTLGLAILLDKTVHVSLPGWPCLLSLLHRLGPGQTRRERAVGDQEGHQEESLAATEYGKGCEPSERHLGGLARVALRAWRALGANIPDRASLTNGSWSPNRSCNSPRPWYRRRRRRWRRLRRRRRDELPDVTLGVTE